MRSREEFGAEVKAAYRGYLGDLDWTHVCTFTFRFPVSTSRAWKSVRQWQEQLQTIHDIKVEWFGVLERDEEGKKHIHALVRTMPFTPVEYLKRQWRSGIS